MIPLPLSRNRLDFTTHITLLCATFLSAARAQDASTPSGKFLYPPASNKFPTFNFLDTIKVSWSTFAPNCTSTLLTLWVTTDTVNNTQQEVYTNDGPVNGSTLVSLNYGAAYARGHFEIVPNCTRKTIGFNSGNFVIEFKEKKSPVVWSLDSSPTASSTSTASARPSSSTSTSSAPPLSSSSSSSSSLSAAAIAGIAVGGALAALFILVALYLTFRARRRKRAASRLESDHRAGLDGDKQARGLDGANKPHAEVREVRAELEDQCLVPMPELDGGMNCYNGGGRAVTGGLGEGRRERDGVA
ncbi:hypothetical protein MMC24_004179 [Lignoscripta atroalba]|nr:hypothetical protein [Lignoscripta atroalba]